MAFERLMRVSQPNSDSAERDLQLLDRVLGDAKKLRQKLGTADRHRMDEYLSSVRSLEQRIEVSSQADRDWHPLAAFDPAQKPEPGIPREHAVHVRLMMDIIALAFQTDTTRVATFMFGNSVSGKNFSFLDGVRGGHHDISHHEDDPEKLRQYHLITKWHIEQYAYLLRRLRDMKEEESNVLDSSMILLGNELRDGNSHSPHNLPLVLAGRANGRIASGQHLVFERDSPIANLYTCMLDAFGAPVERFADSTGRLPGVLV
jgi:hypothetical protein